MSHDTLCRLLLLVCACEFPLPLKLTFLFHFCWQKCSNFLLQGLRGNEKEEKYCLTMRPKVWKSYRDRYFCLLQKSTLHGCHAKIIPALFNLWHTTPKPSRAYCPTAWFPAKITKITATKIWTGQNYSPKSRGCEAVPGFSTLSKVYRRWWERFCCCLERFQIKSSGSWLYYLGQI